MFVWSPVILDLLDEALYKELDEATHQICASRMKQFFPSPAKENYDNKIDNMMTLTTVAKHNNIYSSHWGTTQPYSETLWLGTKNITASRLIEMIGMAE
jgi:hypothetical protein